MGSGSWESATDTGTMTAPSSTGGSGGILSAGSGGAFGSGGLAGAAMVAMPGALPPSSDQVPTVPARPERESQQ